MSKAVASFHNEISWNQIRSHERNLGSISTSFVRQAKSQWYTVFSVQFHQHYASIFAHICEMKFAKLKCRSSNLFAFCQAPFAQKKLLILFEQKKIGQKCWGNRPLMRVRDQIRSFSSWSKLIRDEKEYSLFHPILKQLKMWSLQRYEWHKYESSYFHSDVVVSTKPDGLWQEDNVIKINDFPSRLSNRLRFYLEIGFLFYNRKQ